MRILISAYACSPDRGSEPGNGWHWALGNAQSGHEVWCLTTPEGKGAVEQELRKYPHLKLNVVFVDAPRWANYLYRFQPFVYIHYLVWQYRAASSARQLDKKVNFDLIHHVTLASLQLGSGLWRLEKPLIFGPVGGGNFAPRAFRRYFEDSWYMEVLRKMTSHLLLRFNPDFVKTMRHASLILAANTDTLKMAKKNGAKALSLFLDTGLSPEFFNSTLPAVEKKKDVFKILWVGRIFHRKGLPLVLEALSHVNKQIPFHLTVLGDGKQGAKIPTWLKTYGLEERVSWRGQVPWNEVKSAFMEHDVFMFCSLRDSFGSQFLEAMAFGLPIITLNHQGAGDHIPGNAAIKVSVSNPATTLEELADAVEYLYFHPNERELLGRNGRTFARKYQWDGLIHQMEAYYKSVVPSANPLEKELSV